MDHDTLPLADLGTPAHGLTDVVCKAFVHAMQVWKYEGCRTLSYYLRRRDCIQALAKDLAVPEQAVVATVMKQILECLTVSGLQDDLADKCNLLMEIYALHHVIIMKTVSNHSLVHVVQAQATQQSTASEICDMDDSTRLPGAMCTVCPCHHADC